MCYCELDDGPSVYWESEPTAKRKHVCVECGSGIDPGEKYYKIKGVWDGQFETFKQCAVCRQVWLNVLQGPTECICFGELWNTFGVEYESLPNKALMPDGQTAGRRTA